LIVRILYLLQTELHRGCVNPFIQRLVSGVDSPRELLEGMDPVGSDAEAANYWYCDQQGYRAWAVQRKPHRRAQFVLGSSP
jgi:hypothetical protein